ncbi:MAG: hypothetical protein ABWY93_18850 [Mycobacterium sp.]
MAITTRDQLAVASQNAAVHHYYKSGLTGTATYGQFSLWSQAGWPAAGATGAQACTSATTGAIPLLGSGSGNWYLTGVTAAGLGQSGLTLMDRLWQSNTISIAGSTAALAAGTPTTLPARAGTDYSNYGVYLEATGTSSVSTTAFVNYTNESGVAGRQGYVPQNTGVISPSLTGFTYGPLQLQSGDAGVRSVQSIQMNNSTTGQVITVVIARIVTSLTLPTFAGETRLGYADLGLVNLGPDPCLYWAFNPGPLNATYNTSTLTASVTCVAG